MGPKWVFTLIRGKPFSSGIQSYNADTIGSYVIWFNLILDGNLLLVSMNKSSICLYQCKEIECYFTPHSFLIRRESLFYNAERIGGYLNWLGLWTP